MTQPHAGPRTGPFAVAADRLFDGQRVLPEQAVVVDGGAVRQLLPRAAVPPALPLTDYPGATILPGLIDTHVHCMRWQAPLFLAYGVTTVRDVGNDLGWILAERERTLDRPGPRILCVGPILDGPEPTHPVVSRGCRTPDEAIAAVRETAQAGVDGIKLYHNLRPEWLPAMASAAHDAGLRVSMHCVETGVLAAAEAGVDEFFHLDGILADVWPDHPPGWLDAWGLPGFAGTEDHQARVAQRIAALGMAATPTLAYWQSQWRIRTADGRAASPHVPADVVAWQGSAPQDPVAAERWRRALAAAQGFVRRLLGLGLRVLPGTDVPCGAVTPGLSMWHELALLVESGMTASQALQAATSGAAAFLGRPALGRLVDGSAADLVVVRGDPTRAIPAAPEVLSVVRGGVVYQPAELLPTASAVASGVTGDPWSAQLRAHVRPIAQGTHDAAASAQVRHDSNLPDGQIAG